MKTDFTPGKSLSVLRGLSDPRLAKSAARAAARTFYTDVQDYLTSGAPFRAERGILRKSLRWKSVEIGAMVSAGGPAGYLEFGTGPHVIRAHGGALRFAIAGRVIYRPMVNHPGNVKMQFFYRDMGNRQEHMRAAAAGLLVRRIADRSR